MTKTMQVSALLALMHSGNGDKIIAAQIETALERASNYGENAEISLKIKIAPDKNSESMAVVSFESSTQYPGVNGMTIEKCTKAKTKTFGWINQGQFTAYQPKQDDAFAALPDNVAAMPRAKAN